MSIETAITNAQGKVANCYTAISGKGGTLPATQNLSNMPDAINSIPSGGGKKFGVTAEEFFGNTPNTQGTLDPTAPHMDMSSVNAVAVSYYYNYYFSSAKIKSLSTPVFATWSTYIARYLATGNNCIQYLKVNSTNGAPSGYAWQNMVDGLTNLKVLVLDFRNNNISINTTNNTYWLGGQNYTNKVKSVRIEEMYRPNQGLGYTFHNMTKLQTVWLPKLATVGADTSASNNTLRNCVDNCVELIGFFAPKLQYIGYSTASTTGYAHMQQFLLANASNKMDTLYFPWLVRITCGNTTNTNGTFAGSTGLKKFYAPRLETLNGNNVNNIFYNTSITEFHFGKDHKTNIEASAGYSTLWGRGAGNASVYYDLVAYIWTAGDKFIRAQYEDRMTYLVYNGTTYYRDDTLRSQRDIDWKFWTWVSANNEVVRTQNPVSMVGEAVWQYTTTADDNWDYNDIGNITANDWHYAWVKVDDSSVIVYTTNQWTPAVNDTTYELAQDGRSFVVGNPITQTSSKP